MAGRIYKITGYGLTYYGSTKKTLNARKQDHKQDCKRYKLGKIRNRTSSYDILEQGTDWTIELVEIVEDDTQLLIREGYHIKNNECVNKHLPGRTEQERREYGAQYLEKTKESRNVKDRARKRERINCQTCGKEMNRSSLSRHNKSQHK